MDELQRGADIEIDCTNSTPLNLADGFAVHLRYVGQKSETPIAKYANTATTGYTVRLFAVDLSATPATFKMKIDKAETAAWDPNKTIEGALYLQTTNTDYSDNDFRPVTAWVPLGTTSASLIATTEIGA